MNSALPLAAGSSTPVPSEPNPKSCFICLQTPEETPGETWVTPCPCTLEAHEACMLRWIAETEASGDGKSKLRCPACNSRIQLLEPWDPVVAIGDSCTMLYRRTSPFLLMSIFMTMGIAGSGYYGYQSMVLFAGSPKTLTWLGLRRTRAYGPQIHIQTLMDGAIIIWKLFLLNLIAPCLLLQRALPTLGNLIALPSSFVYGVVLISRNKLPTWPPSPEWALTMMPYVSFAYSNAYYDIFGSLERRLNQALRGRPATAEAQEEAVPPENADPEAAGAMQPRGDGVIAAMRRVGHALTHFLRHNDDLGIENVGAAAAFGNGQEIEFQLEIVVGEGEEVIRPAPAPAPAPARREQGNREQVGDNAEEDAALPPPDIRRARLPEEAQDEQRQVDAGDNGDDNNNDVVNGNANRNNELAGDANRAVTLFSDILSVVTTQLLLPRISALVGGALERTLPRSWVKRAPFQKPTSMLQEKWGRSLVGGCLFIVLRDALSLYVKYRRVQVKQHRKIQNVDRQRGQGTVGV